VIALVAYPRDARASALFTPLGRSSTTGVSDDGRVVVGRYLPEGATLGIGGRWTAATGWVSLGGVHDPAGISGDGRVIFGRYASPSGQPPPGPYQPFRWTAEDGWRGLGWLPGGQGNPFGTSAADISYDGSVIVGTAGTSEYDASRSVLNPYRWTEAGGMQSLGLRGWGTGVSPDGSIVIGFGKTPAAAQLSVDPGAFEAFRWTAATGVRGLGFPSRGPGERLYRTSASAISNDGLVVLGSAQMQDESGPFQGTWRWTSEAGMVLSPNLPIAAVNADGSIAVGLFDAQSAGIPELEEAAIWDAAHGSRRLKDVLVEEYGLGDRLAGWSLRQARNITPDGRFIIGVGINPATGLGEGWLVDLAVPEPAGAAVIGALAAFLITRRRALPRPTQAH
jgi:uncharacterized membrane protein